MTSSLLFEDQDGLPLVNELTERLGRLPGFPADLVPEEEPRLPCRRYEFVRPGADPSLVAVHEGAGHRFPPLRKGSIVRQGVEERIGVRPHIIVVGFGLFEEAFRTGIANEISNLNYGIQAEVQFTTDGHDIQEQIKKTDFAGTPLIIGSNWEKKLASDIGAHYVNVSYPMLEKLVINDHIAGYSGGLHLLEQIFSAAMSKLKL